MPCITDPVITSCCDRAQLYPSLKYLHTVMSFYNIFVYLVHVLFNPRTCLRCPKVSEVCHLGALPNLKNLTLKDNPLSQSDFYHIQVLAALKSSYPEVCQSMCTVCTYTA